MASYGHPRRLNAVSLFLLLLVGAGAYWMWRFFPAYFDAWTVDHTLKELASRMYKANRLSEPQRSRTMKDLLDKARSDIYRQTSITDPDLAIDLSIEETTATVTADYDLVVTHPGLTQTTKMHFTRVETANIKAVNWE
jgi:hypothetical protein